MYLKKKEEKVSQLTHKCLKTALQALQVGWLSSYPSLWPCSVPTSACTSTTAPHYAPEKATTSHKGEQISKRKTNFLREDNLSSQGSPLLKLGAVSKFRIVLYTVSSSALPSPSLTSDFEKDFYLSAKSQLTSPPRESPLFLQEETWTTTKIIFNYTVTCRYKFHFPT